jgi:hypothetical protein
MMGLLADYAAQLRKIADTLDSLNPSPLPAPIPVDPFMAVFRSRYGWTSQLTDEMLIRNIRNVTREDWLRYAADERAWMVSIIGREPGQQPPPVVPVPLPVPPTAWEPAQQYTNVANFREVLAAHRDFSYGINLDNRDAFDDGTSRFGPATNFYSWPDGTVRQGTSPAGLITPRRPGEALLGSYPNRAALIADAQAVGWAFAVLLDGEPLIGGFEASPPANYVSRNGRVERA